MHSIQNKNNKLFILLPITIRFLICFVKQTYALLLKLDVTKSSFIHNAQNSK